MIRYTITIPCALNDGTPVPYDYFDYCRMRAAEFAGGCTLHPESEGLWLNDAGEYVVDRVRVLEIIADPGLFGRVCVQELAEHVRVQLMQETVMVTAQPILVDFV